MAASVNDKFSKVSTGVRPTTTTVASIRSVAGTSLICDDLTGWDTDAAVHFSTYQLDGQGDVVAGTQTDMKGTVSGNTISNIVITGGTDAGNAVGDIVQALPTARYAKDLADGLLVSLDQDGTLKAGAVDNAAALANEVVTTAKIADGSVTSEKLTTTVAFRAYISSAVNMVTGTIVAVPYDTESYDVGGNFSTSTGKFTAPYNGIYHFEAIATFGSGNERAYAYIYVNNAVATRGIDYDLTNGTSDVRAVMVTDNLSLSANDIVEIRIFTDDGVDTSTGGSTENHFSGYLVGRV